MFEFIKMYHLGTIPNEPVVTTPSKVTISADHVCKEYEGLFEEDFFQCIDGRFCISKKYRYNKYFYG